MIQNTSLSLSFSKNRAEELPDDLWGNYVLPLNYSKYNPLNLSKSTIIKGGRGSGKTVFLKYHCYPTIFSNKKKNISEKDMNNIGIYWRPDTDFSNMITENYLQKNWKVAFEAYIGLSILSEFSKLVFTLLNSRHITEENKHILQKLTLPRDFNELFNESENINLPSLDMLCQSYRSKLNDWLNYPEGKPPIIFGAKEKIIFFINFTLKKLSIFDNTTFHIFIDEFENLAQGQQVLINTWIKHSQAPLIFHIAYKKHYIVTSKTQSDEHIVDVNDYRIIDLENIYKDHFETLASEIIFSKISKHFNHTDEQYDLSDIDSLKERSNIQYQKSIKKRVKLIFPSLSIKDTADELFKDSALVNKLKKLICDGLHQQRSPLNPDLFINVDLKRESIINGILLNRKGASAEEILDNFISKNMNFYENHITNHLLGGILFLYSVYEKKTCPYYAGFDRFVMLSQSNIRHLLELCYQSIVEYEINQPTPIKSLDEYSIPYHLQAKAVKLTSGTQINKVSKLGNYGKELQKIVIRLGKIFLLSQKRKTQSISEMNQFTVKGYEVGETEERADLLINECKIWGILIERQNNKKTTEKDHATHLYILHPIFAPFFGISPRDKRKKDFSYDDFKKIFLDNEEAYLVLYNQYIKEWSPEESKDSVSYNTNSLLDLI